MRVSRSSLSLDMRLDVLECTGARTVYNKQVLGCIRIKYLYIIIMLHSYTV